MTIVSVGLTKTNMGPYKIIGHFYGEINGPIQIPEALARLTKEVLGPYEIIGHFCEEINGPIQRRNSGLMRNHRPLLWRDQWAHSDASAGLTKEILSP
jgi:hypothetical protein